MIYRRNFLKLAKSSNPKNERETFPTVIKYVQNSRRLNSILVPRGRALFGQHQESRPLWGSKDRDSWTSRHSARAQSQVWQIWLAEKTKLLLCECSENWTLPEDLILGADRKKCGLWEREWLNSSLSLTDQLLTAYSWKTSYSVSV